MSQVYLSVASTPAVPIQFTADDATTAVPAANNLNIFSQQTSDNNSNGIQTSAIPNAGSSMYIELTNRLSGSGSTVGGTTLDIISLDTSALPTAGTGTYTVSAIVSGYVSAGAGTPFSVGYTLTGAFRSTGGVASVIPNEALDEFEEDASIAAADAELEVSGATLLLRLTGVAGFTINWTASLTYQYAG